MTTLSQSVSRVSSKVGVLASIKDPEVNLAIWERPSPAEAVPLLKDDLRDLRFDCTLDELEMRLVDELEAGGYDTGPQRERLVRDIAELAKRFCDLMETDEVDVRLEVVTTDSCRKFHGDYVKARLITTYLGEGTQWLEEADVARVSLDLEPLEVKQLGAGDVGIFKGKLATDRPAIHRSPPIGSTGEKRLLLVLNPVHTP